MCVLHVRWGGLEDAVCVPKGGRWMRAGRLLALLRPTGPNACGLASLHAPCMGAPSGRASTCDHTARAGLCEVTEGLCIAECVIAIRTIAAAHTGGGAW